MGKPVGRQRRIFSSEISHSARVSIFDMLHSFAPRYSHPSIRHLQPSLMPGLCKRGQRRGLWSHTDISQEVQMSAETGKHEKLRQRLQLEPRHFYDVSSWQQVTKNITWDSGVSRKYQNNHSFWQQDAALYADLTYLLQKLMEEPSFSLELSLI